jgi:large subunit ribosomal protein L6
VIDAMSRVGKQLIQIPEGVEVKIDGDLIIIKGKKGELKQKIRPEINVEIKDKNIFLSEAQKTKNSAALWGTSRALINNMIKGAANGFEKRLIIEGIGFRAVVNGNKLVLNIGFSHPVEVEAPQGIELKVEKNTIIISGCDKQMVGQIAAEIRSKRKPEPYKGKGIRYEGEIIRRKAGKKAVSTA